MNFPRFTILIVNYKTPDLIRGCLESVRECSQNSSYEMIVVDNDSKDESLAYLRRQADIRLINRTSGLHYGPRDHGEALDIGQRYAQGEYLVVLDSDVIVLKPGWLEEMELILVKEGGVLIGPCFYRQFIHPCFLMIRRDILNKYKIQFSVKPNFHTYYDTGEFATAVLLKNKCHILKLFSWPGNAGGSETAPITGEGIGDWMKKWWSAAGRHGAFIGDLAFHAFYGTRILNSDCDGFMEAVQNRQIDAVEIQNKSKKFKVAYCRLESQGFSFEKFRENAEFFIRAATWCLMRILIKIRDMGRFQPPLKKKLSAGSDD